MYYFKSIYSTTFTQLIEDVETTFDLVYSVGWYGELDYAPPATVLLYNDVDGFCIGTIDEIIDGIEYITEEQANEYISNADLDNPKIWAGEKLANRW